MGRFKRTSFVLRVVQDERGQASGIVERVATGAKEAFAGMEELGPIILRMLRRETGLTQVGSDKPVTGEPHGLAKRSRAGPSGKRKSPRVSSMRTAVAPQDHQITGGR